MYIINYVVKFENIDNIVLFVSLLDLLVTGNRVRIYTYWFLISFVNVFELVRVGFVFIGMDDIVKCYKC